MKKMWLPRLVIRGLKIHCNTLKNPVPKILRGQKTNFPRKPFGEKLKNTKIVIQNTCSWLRFEKGFWGPLDDLSQLHVISLHIFFLLNFTNCVKLVKN